MNDKNVLFMAGGTGGHVYPGIAIAKELESRGYRIHWLGTKNGIESRLVPAEGFSLHLLKIKGVRGKHFLKKVFVPISIIIAIIQAIKIVRKINPACVVGFGGYVAGPGGVAAYLMRKPLIIHEQNTVAGTTNKLLAKMAERVLLAFPGALPGGVVTGNPVRAEMRKIQNPEQRFNDRQGPIRILIFGGSLGASAINKLIPNAVKLLRETSEFKIKHQTGKNDSLLVQDAYKKINIDAEVYEFIDDMSAALDWADFVICRSGALTVSEMATVGLGAIYIPFPYAVDDHQTKNAQFVCRENGGHILQERDAKPEVLAKLIKDFFIDRKTLLSMANNALSKAMPNTEKEIANICEEFIHV